jgi:cyanophycin synthetase
MTRPPREPDPGSGFPSPTIVDSRRLMGPNLLHAGVGAVLDVSLVHLDPANVDAVMEHWHGLASMLGETLGWTDLATAERRYPGGASLFLSAPVDQLMTATEVAERAWVCAERSDDFAISLEDVHASSHREANPAFRALYSDALRRGINCTFDDERVHIGTGTGTRGWPLREIPPLAEIEWTAVHDVPTVLVTGSNGKTTVVRMIAHMARAAGHAVGYTCTDGVWIGDQQIDAGDYSGPVGARRVLQDPSVTFAVLETARGGILRRGIALQRASVAVVTTIAADHLGDYGVTDIETLAQVKLVVSRAVQESGVLVYNAGVPVLVDATREYAGRTVAIDPALLDATQPALAGIPATLGGRATHNVLNAALALAVCDELALGDAARVSLRQFGARASDNVGRLTVQEIGGVTVVVDYAHNPQSIDALIRGTSGIPAARRAITLATGGDRDDVALREIADAAHATGLIDLYIAKEMPRFLRGRPSGSISGVIADQLRVRGVPDAQVHVAADDLAATMLALEWARPGDLLLLGVHDQRETILALLDALDASQWRPLMPLPEIAPR